MVNAVCPPKHNTNVFQKYLTLSRSRLSVIIKKRSTHVENITEDIGQCPLAVKLNFRGLLIQNILHTRKNPQIA